MSARSSKKKPAPAKRKAGGSARVLVVEDEQSLRELYVQWLEMSGYTVLQAADGLVGIETILHEKPDLVVLDIMLPKKDGFEILAEVRRNPAVRDTPVIVLTSLDQEFEKRQGGKLGADAYIVKTDLSPSRLKDAVASFMKKKS